MSKPTLPPIVLLLGARRSGTTLLRTVLDRHPDLAVHPAEPQMIRDVWRLYGDPIWNVPAAVQTVCTHRLCPPEVRCDDLLRRLPPAPIDVRALVTAYLAAWLADAPAGRPIVLKDPYFVFHIDRLEALFPGARWLHIVRDPRANVASQRARWPEASLLECTQWWLDAIAIGNRLQARAPARYAQIRYEDLVRAPEPTLAAVCAFLGVMYRDDLRHFQLDTTGYLADGRPVAERFTDFDPSRLDRWQQQLAPIEVALIEQLCAVPMAALDYPLRRPSADRRALRQMLARQRTAYAALRAGRRVKAWGRALRRSARRAVRR